MRRTKLVVSILLVFVLTVSLSACGGNSGSEEKQESPKDPSISEAQDLYSQTVEGEKEVLDAMDQEFGMDFAKKLASFGSAEDGRGFHLVGTKAGKDAADYAYDTFKDIGLKPEYHEFDAKGWTYNSSDIKIKGHEDLSYFITSAPYTPGTEDDGLTAEIEFIRTGTKEELEGKDLSGKIALAEFDWDIVPWHNDLAKQVTNHNGIGLIYYMTNGYGTDETGEAEFVGDWSGKRTDIPVWSMKLKEGKELSQLAKKEKLTATLTSDVDLNEEATGYNVLATIEGEKYPDEYIVINAHTDAYFHCFQDDSLPVGIMMTMAKAMVDSGYKPDHSIIFISTDGEEVGSLDTYYDWLWGSWALVNDKVKEWDGKIVDAHTLELVADDLSTNMGYRVSDPMYLFTTSMANAYNEAGELKNKVSVDNFMSTASDEWCFAYMGHPTTRTLREDKAGEVYHSSIDTSENRFDKEKYLDHLTIQSALIMRIDKQAAAPYDLSKAAKRYYDEIDADLLNAQDLDGTGLKDSVKGYYDSAKSLRDKNMEIEKLYREKRENGEDLTEADKLITDYNKALRESVKEVTLGTNYIALDEPVSQIEYYQYLPAIYQKAIKNLEDGDGAKMLKEFDVDNEDQAQFSYWYSTQLDEETWLESYEPTLDPENKDYDFSWVTDRVLKNYDFYSVNDDISKKVNDKDTNYADEIETLKSYEEDLMKRLGKAYEEDLQMWESSNKNLPVDLADEILESLKK